MRFLGRLLQNVGLVVLPLGMLLQVTTDFSVGQMLLMLLFGAAAFWVGRIIEGYAK